MKRVWNEGDFFLIPIDAKGYGVGQVLAHEKSCMDSVLCAFFAPLLSGADQFFPDLFGRESLIAIHLITRESIDRGYWPVVGNGKPLSIDSLYPIKELRSKGYIGAKVKGSKIMEDFFLAYHGVAAWDSYADVEYFDKMLIDGVDRPQSIFFEKK